MFETYEEALEWIHTRRGMGPKPGIRRMEWMMERLDHPEQKFKSIHIAGTNGKGSTVAYLTSLFKENGHTVGSFTSPHIMKFNERISLNGKPISDEEVVGLANRIRPLYEEISLTELGGLTEFEVVTSMMFLYFSQVKPNVVLLEVGLGGLFDSTNVVVPNLSVITTIGIDHIKILGSTIEEIAFQKAGIIKDSVSVVMGNISYPAKKVLLEVAKERGAKVSMFGETFKAEHHPTSSGFHETFDYQSDTCDLENLEISLMGKHQVENAATALHVFRIFCDENQLSYTKEKIKTGLLHAFWPVRMEVVSQKPLVILDGAHNEPAMKALLKALENHFSGKKIHVLYASLTTKELEKIGEWLKRIPNSTIHLTTFDFPQVASLIELEERMEIPTAIYHPNWQAAVKDLLEKTKDDELLLITGSLYFLSKVRHLLLKK